MPQRSLYQENRPLFNSLIIGIFYFLLSMFGGFSEGAKMLFMVFMLFLPGLTFPAATCYQYAYEKKLSFIRLLTHIILSISIYFVCIWFYWAANSAENLEFIPASWKFSISDIYKSSFKI